MAFHRKHYYYYLYFPTFWKFQAKDIKDNFFSH